METRTQEQIQQQQRRGENKSTCFELIRLVDEVSHRNANEIHANAVAFCSHRGQKTHEVHMKGA